ncbi:hypothetical protein [Gracilimonas sp. BCB1]|uniref:hypothetical protein n=1 Tax=Gracilimonas sp. BCB1 TaxID=3152362 RepID=UPI0032D9A02F
MSENRIKLADPSKGKNITKYILSGLFLFMYPVLMVLLADELTWGSLNPFSGKLMYGLFLLMGSLFLMSGMILHWKQNFQFISFSENSIKFRDNSLNVEKFNYSDILKVEEGSTSATFYLIDGRKKILNFGQASNQNKETINEELNKLASRYN